MTRDALSNVIYIIKKHSYCEQYFGITINLVVVFCYCYVSKVVISLKRIVLGTCILMHLDCLNKKVVAIFVKNIVILEAFVKY